MAKKKVKELSYILLVKNIWEIFMKTKNKVLGAYFTTMALLMKEISKTIMFLDMEL